MERILALPKQSTKTEVNELNEETNASLMATCINTGLKLTFVIKTSKHGSNNLEDFLIAAKNTSSRSLVNADVLNTRTIK